jgi:predicted nucleic acid-binding protein
MEVILDTNGLSAWLDGDEELKLKLIDAPKVWLSPVVLGEYRFGIKASRHREVYELKLADLEMDIPTLPIDAATSASYAEIRQALKKCGRPIPWHDVWIAAQAKQQGFGIVSRDGHFDFVQGITRFGW